MKDPIYFLLLGLGPGALFAMIGASMVVAYKGSGVINFAQPAMAQFVVFTYVSMRLSGRIQLPWVDFLPTEWLNIPVDIKISDGDPGFWPAFLIAMAMAVLLGLMVHFLVFRPLRNAAPLGKVIGSVGILTYLTGVMELNFKFLNNPNPLAIVPNEGIRNFLFLGSDRVFDRSIIYLTIIALLVGAGLWALYRYTRFGIATRAAAGNEKGAVLLGYSPEFLAAANWIIATVVAGFAAIIVGPFGGSLSAVQLTGLLGFFLAAMLIGKLTSPMMATLGGLALGMVSFGFTQSWLVAQGWFPQWLRAGARQAIPLIAIVVILYVTGKKLPIRGTVEEKRLPLAPYPKRMVPHTLFWSAVVIILAFFGKDLFDKVLPFALMTGLITAILCLSYVVITGYVGQISLAQLSLSGVAAFFMARMMADGQPTITNPFAVSGPNLNWFIAMILGIIMAIAVGLIVAIPALRIRGVQLAVVTIAAAVTLQALYFENEKLTGLRAGAPGEIRKPFLFIFDIGSTGSKGLTNNPSFVIFALVMLVGCCWLVANIRRSGTGRRFLSVRANERAAAAAGVNVPRTKMLAFAIGAGLAGLAGTLFAIQIGNVSSASFVFTLGLTVLAFTYLAGITSINGAIIAGMLAPASVITVVSAYLFKGAAIEDYVPIIGGISLIFTAIIHPEGIAPFFQPVMRHAGNWLAHARQAEWLSFAKRYGPWIVGGWIAGFLIWPARVSSYNKFWMPLVGVIITMMLVRPIVLGIYWKITGKERPALPGHEGDHAAAELGLPPPGEVAAAAHASSAEVAR
jgi:ABC-type branched-subunit amino acid transport system permease subunit